MGATGHRPMVLEVPVEIDDGAGGSTTQWQALGTHWVRTTRSSARGANLGMQSGVRARTVLEMRSVAAGSSSRPAAGHRLRDGTKVFEILSVEDVADDRFRLRLVVTGEVAR